MTDAKQVLDQYVAIKYTTNKSDEDVSDLIGVSRFTLHKHKKENEEYLREKIDTFIQNQTKKIEDRIEGLIDLAVETYQKTLEGESLGKDSDGKDLMPSAYDKIRVAGDILSGKGILKDHKKIETDVIEVELVNEGEDKSGGL